jgi:hypothetical protein
MAEQMAWEKGLKRLRRSLPEAKKDLDAIERSLKEAEERPAPGAGAGTGRVNSLLIVCGEVGEKEKCDDN